MLSLAVFFVSYALFVFGRGRAWVALGGALTLIAFGVVTWEAALYDMISWNVIGLFLGTLVLAELFMQSRMPAVLAEWFVDRTQSARTALIVLCVLASVLSMFVENVAVVLIVAPICLTLCQRLQISPIQPMIFLAMFSNLQGTATLIGDPPSMILGSYMKMTFNDFFFYLGKPSIFFIVQTGFIFSLLYVFFLWRHLGQQFEPIKIEKVRSIIPTILLGMLIIILAMASLVDPEFRWVAGTTALALAMLGLIWYRLGPHWSSIRTLIRELDWDTTFFLTGLFVIVGALKTDGWIDSLSQFMAQTLPSNPLHAYISLIAISVAISAFVDNVPFLLTMLPVTESVSSALGTPLPLMVFGLLIGACLGGNITPIGASANIVAMGILRREGHAISFGSYMRHGLLFTLAAVIPAAALLWWIWS